MKPFPHTYHASLEGGSSGYARLSAPGMPELPVAPPVEFDGPGDAWSPEHLLLASVESCFLLTLRAVARLNNVAFTALTAETEGVVDRKERVTRFTEIILRPRLTIPAGGNEGAALRAMERTEKACIVTSSLSTPVRLEPEVIVASE